MYNLDIQLYTMRHTELFYLLALQKVEGVGDVIAKKLLAQCGSAEAVFKAKPIKLGGIGSHLYSKLKDSSIFHKAEKELRFIEDHPIKVWSFRDPDYPERLKHCLDGPLLLFTTGNIDFSARKVLSIVGTRQATAYGADFCRTLISDLAVLNPVIVSGFAYGIDIVAHQAAMDNGLQTVGIVAHGLNQIYPKQHKKFVSAMQSNGGFISEFWSTVCPDKENFVRRNRIVAGLSEATIVIESADKGGSLITANFANDYNRDVFAVPGRVTDYFSQGCNTLIKTQKANVLTSAADVIYGLNWDLGQKESVVQKQLFVTLEDDEQKIYDFLQQNGKELLDIIALQCAFPVYKISSILLNMELKGVIRPLPGKWFEAI